MDIKKNEQGVTFISMLLTLFIIIITMPIIIHFLNYVHPLHHEEELSAQQFFVFIRNDIIMAQHVYSQNNKIYFQLSSEETAVIEQYKDIVRRQVNGRGHETYIRNVDTFTVEQLKDTVKIILTNKEGSTYDKAFSLYE